MRNRIVGRRLLLGGVLAAGTMAVLPGGAAAHLQSRKDQQTIDDLAARLDRRLIALRRDIHAHPEGPGEESRTAAVVAAELRSAGLEVATGVGGHGVVGVLHGRRPGRTVAYRADMDAVPADGQLGGGSGPAHLCGHDLHTTIGVGVARVLAQLRSGLRGNIVFIFQPAEETLSGARAMLADGVLDRTSPEEIHALHCGPFPVGRFAVTPGNGMPGQDWSVITVSGPDAAGKARRLATEINDLGTVAPPRTVADMEQLVVDLHTPDGPLSRFIFIRAEAGEPADDGRVQLRVQYRCWPEERYLEIRDQIRGLADGHDGAEVTFPDEPFPAMVCPERDGRRVKRHLRRVVGPEAVTTLHAALPFNGEDFALFLDRIPGTYTYLGVRTPGAGITSSFPHHADFDPDERAIGVGVRGMAGWLSDRAGRQAGRG